MQNDNSAEKLALIKKQFLCNVPVKEICWQDLPPLNPDTQEEIINNTVRLSTVLKHPISINYQKSFLKNLLQLSEKQDSVISDILYQEYARLVALPESSNSFKHYSLEKTDSIILKEDICLISQGTTGLRTWQASLALSEWILSNKSHFTSKIILELGSGIGLTGLVILECKPQTVYLSDCHASVLSTLRDNIILNIDSEREKIHKLDELLHLRTGSSIVSVLDLPWENISYEFCQKLGHVDKIIGADIVYDRSIFKPLVNAVESLFKYCGAEEFILSCTERNEETLEDFLALIRQKFNISNVEVPPQKNFLWCTAPPVKIFSIHP